MLAGKRAGRVKPSLPTRSTVDPLGLGPPPSLAVKADCKYCGVGLMEFRILRLLVFEALGITGIEFWD